MQSSRRNNDRHDASRSAPVAPMTCCALHDVECAGQVRVNDRAPALLGEIDSVLWKLAAGAIDEQVDTASRKDISEGCIDGGSIADIQCDRLASQTARLDRFADPSQLLQLTPANHDLCPESSGKTCGCFADSAAAAGHEHCAIGEGFFGQCAGLLQR